MNPRPLEDECQRVIVNAARDAGWRVYHNRPTEDRKGRWRTALQGHQGFPDLVMVHAFAKCVWFVELKRRPNVLRPDQQAWADDLTNAGADWRVVWVPEGQDEFVQLLYDIGRSHLFRTKPTATVHIIDPLLLAHIDEAAE